MFFQREGPLRRLISEGPILRRIMRDRTEFQTVPIPSGVNPVDFVVNIAQGDWASHAAQGWVNRLGLSGPTRDEILKRMQVAYAAGLTGASPEVAADAQRRLGLGPGAVQPIPPSQAPRRGRPRRAEVTEAAAAAPLTATDTEKQIVMRVIAENTTGLGRGLNAPIAILAVVPEAKRRGVENPENVLKVLIAEGTLEPKAAGRAVARV